MKIIPCAVFAGLAACLAISNADACSRVTFTTQNGTVVTGRSMDWPKDDSVKMKVYPRGQERDGNTDNPIKWVSKYGSVVVISYGQSNSGVNEKHLAVDTLYLATSNYGKPLPNEKTLATASVVQFLLDNFATAEEVATYFETNKPRLVAETKTGLNIGAPITLHYIVTDKDGNNVIIEYLDGTPSIHRVKGKAVLTNDPSYEKMLAIRDFFKEAGAENSMPGSALSQARFAYLSSWLDQFIEKRLDDYTMDVKDYSFDLQAVISVLSLMRGVSTPLGIQFSWEHPNNTSTLWRTGTDLKNGWFYFDSALAPTTIWVELAKIDFTKESTLDLKHTRMLNGDVTEMLNH